MDTTAAVLLSTHLAATAAMTGLIWFVQVVHYPLFARVGADHAVPYAVDHQRRTSYVVAVPMALEGVTVLILLADPPDGVGRLLALIGAALLAGVLVSTVALQVPLHAALARSHDIEVVRRLVRTNWIRTVGWTTRTVLAVVMLVRAA